MAAIDLLDSVNQKYDNSSSSLTSTNAKLAIDELSAIADASAIASASWIEGSNTYRITSLTGTNYDTVITNFTTLTLNSVTVATVDDATALAIALG